MSWYGKHPLLAKDVVRRFVSPNACAECIYWLRLTVTGKPYTFQGRIECLRCGFCRSDAERELIAALCREQQSTRS